MKTVNPYLNFMGNTEEAFNFYKSVFGGDFAMVQRFKETPEGPKVPDKEKDMLMHISLPLGQNVLMATDALESQNQKVIVGNNISLSVSADSKSEADKLFSGLSQDAKIDMPMENTFWGSYFGMLTDKFGIQWMVSYDEPKK